MKCIICNNELDVYVVGKCNHKYHEICLGTWFRRRKEEKCPICNKEFVICCELRQ